MLGDSLGDSGPDKSGKAASSRSPSLVELLLPLSTAAGSWVKATRLPCIRDQ